MRGEKEVCKYLSSGVDDLGRKVLVLVANELAECVLYGRVIAVHEVAVDKLHRQTRLSCAPRQLGTSHMLRDAQAEARIERATTYRQLYYPRWPPFSASVRPASCCWLSGEVVRKLSGSPVSRKCGFNPPLGRSCLAGALLGFRYELASSG